MPGCIYSEEQVRHFFGIEKHTLRRWELAGLRPLRPGTKRKFYHSDDVIRVLQIDPAALPKYEPQYKTKAKGKG